MTALGNAGVTGVRRSALPVGAETVKQLTAIMAGLVDDAYTSKLLQATLDGMSLL